MFLKNTDQTYNIDLQEVVGFFKWSKQLTLTFYIIHIKKHVSIST